MTLSKLILFMILRAPRHQLPLINFLVPRSYVLGKQSEQQPADEFV